MQLLIVDDHIHQADSLAVMLPWARFGITKVHKAYSGSEAIDTLSSHVISIVITDIRMPGMSGLELVGAIRRTWKETKCILLSGHADFAYAQQAIAGGVADYLLKPVKEQALVDAIERVTRELKAEWEERSSFARAMRALTEQLPLLSSSLLLELLGGRKFQLAELRERLDLCGLPFTEGDPVSLMMIRLEHETPESTVRDRSLTEQSVYEMVQEIFGAYFRLWRCKDAYDYLVLLLKPIRLSPAAGPDAEPLRLLVEALATQAQYQVKQMLGDRISVLISPWGVFHQELAGLYASAVALFRQRIGNGKELFIHSLDSPAGGHLPALVALYEPPQLHLLMETGRWDKVTDKLNAIFAELDAKWVDSQEHLLEVYFSLAGAITYFQHKNNRRLSALAEEHYRYFLQAQAFRSVEHLRAWAFDVVRWIAANAEDEHKRDHSQIVDKIRKFIGERLATDASLTAIAEHVRLHPSYLSRVYKAETGESLSDYLLRLRMEIAAQRLLDTNDKIYEITLELGYQNPQYFIKLFKKQYGVTPQEYRQRLYPKETQT